MDKWLRKYYTHTLMHTYNGILSSHKTNKMLPFSIHGWSLRLSEISTENSLAVAKGERWDLGEMGEADLLEVRKYKDIRYPVIR